jgi:hypothetical protein
MPGPGGLYPHFDTLKIGARDARKIGNANMTSGDRKHE